MGRFCPALEAGRLLRIAIIFVGNEGSSRLPRRTAPKIFRQN